MANYDMCAAGTGLPVDGGGKHFIIKNLLNCYNSVAEGGWGTAAYSGNTFTIFKVKEGWLVNRIWFRNVLLATTTAAIDCIGDTATGTTAWVATDAEVGTSGTINTAVGCLHTDTNGALNGFLYKADDEIIVTFKTANFDGKIEFAMEVIDVFGGVTIV